MKKTNSILVLIIFIMLYFPMFQGRYNILKLSPLKGDIPYHPNVSFTKAGWNTTYYQTKKEQHLHDMFGFRSLMVRIHNQIFFSLFNETNAKEVIIGKNGYLYEEKYLLTYAGKDYIGEDNIKNIINKLKYINDTLSKINKSFIIIFASGKASYYPEFIPEKYLPASKQTNYKVFANLMKNSGLNYIDFNKYTMLNKRKSQYPLYSKVGIHWSTYMSALAADSIIKSIENIRKIDIPNFKFNSVSMQKPKNLDYEIADGMNLLFRLDAFDVGYPNIYIENSSGKTKPSILMVSDSFFWEMYMSGIMKCFKENSNFWYYNRASWPESEKKQLSPKNMDLNLQLKNHDVFMIMATERNLDELGWGFIERLHDHFLGLKENKMDSINFQQKVKGFIKYIKTQPDWMKGATEKSKKTGIPLDSVILLDAIWQTKLELKQTK